MNERNLKITEKMKYFELTIKILIDVAFPDNILIKIKIIKSL